MTGQKKHSRTASSIPDDDRDSDGLETLFHHFPAEIKPWTRAERRPVGEGGINGKAEVIESILHHLLFDVGVKPQHLDAEEEQAPPPPGREHRAAGPGSCRDTKVMGECFPLEQGKAPFISPLEMRGPAAGYGEYSRATLCWARLRFFCMGSDWSLAKILNPGMRPFQLMGSFCLVLGSRRGRGARTV